MAKEFVVAPRFLFFRQAGCSQGSSRHAAFGSSHNIYDVILRNAVRLRLLNVVLFVGIPICIPGWQRRKESSTDERSDLTMPVGSKVGVNTETKPHRKHPFIIT